jgi:hypothetical protein
MQPTIDTTAPDQGSPCLGPWPWYALPEHYFALPVFNSATTEWEDWQPPGDIPTSQALSNRDHSIKQLSLCLHFLDMLRELQGGITNTPETSEKVSLYHLKHLISEWGDGPAGGGAAYVTVHHLRACCRALDLEVDDSDDPMGSLRINSGILRVIRYACRDNGRDRLQLLWQPEIVQ